MEVWVTVLASKLEHYGSRHRGERFRCSKQIADKLAARGVVQIEGEADPENPTGAAGGKSSASQAGHPSPPQTPDGSEPGETQTDSENPPPDSQDPPADATAPAKSKRGGRKGKTATATDSASSSSKPEA